MAVGCRLRSETRAGWVHSNRYGSPTTRKAGRSSGDRSRCSSLRRTRTRAVRRGRWSPGSATMRPGPGSTRGSARRRPPSRRFVRSPLTAIRSRAPTWSSSPRARHRLAATLGSYDPSAPGLLRGTPLLRSRPTPIAGSRSGSEWRKPTVASTPRNNTGVFVRIDGTHPSWRRYRRMPV